MNDHDRKHGAHQDAIKGIMKDHRTLRDRVDELPSTAIMDCPKCGHPTLFHTRSHNHIAFGPDYQCLTCGTEYDTKTEPCLVEVVDDSP